MIALPAEKITYKETKNITSLGYLSIMFGVLTSMPEGIKKGGENKAKDLTLFHPLNFIKISTGKPPAQSCLPAGNQTERKYPPSAKHSARS